MKITDIDFTNAIAIAQLTSVLLIIAFLLAFYVFNKVDKDIRARKHSK